MYFLSRATGGVGAVMAASLVISLLTAGTVAPDADNASNLRALAEASPVTVQRAAHVATTSIGTNAIDSTVGGTDVRVAADPQGGIKLTGPDSSLSIGLPDTPHLSDAQVVAPGIVSFENSNGASSLAAVSDTGAVQLSTVIDGPTTANRYSYPVAVEGGGRVLVSDDGLRALIVQGNDVVATVDAAWAKDADGVDVPTHYSTDGHTLTQVVDTSARSIKYPVVADPKFVLYLGFAPSMQLNKKETKSTATLTGAAAICGQIAKYAGSVAGGLCGVSLLQIVAKGAQNSTTGQCSWLVLEPPLILAWSYSGGFCK
jgi:hypothetical protein